MPDTGKYPIKAVCQLTGLSPDLIRAWERRYGAIAPDRAARNQRLYSDRDVARLALLKQATAAGHAIGRIAALPDEALASLVAAAPVAPEPDHGPLAERIAAAIERLDYMAADEALGQAAAMLPPEQLIDQVVLPVLDRLGHRWQQPLGIAAEHLATSLLRSLLGTLLRTRTLARHRAPVLLSTLPGELHEMGLLVAALSVASHGVPVCYLGPNLPADELIGAAERIGAFAVGLSLVLPPSEERLGDLARIATSLGPGTRLWLGGSGALATQRGALPASATVIPSLAALPRLLG